MGPALVGTGLRALRPPALWCCTGRWPAFPPGTVSPSPPLPSCRWPQTPCTPVHSTRAHGRISGELESWGAAGRPGLKVHTLVQRARRLLPAVPTHLHGLPQGSRLQPPGPGPAACHGMTPSGATAPTPSPAACRARTPPPHRSSEGARRGRGRRPSWSGDSGVGNRVAGAPGGRRGQHVAGQTPPPPAGDAGRTPGSPLPPVWGVALRTLAVAHVRHTRVASTRAGPGRGPRAAGWTRVPGTNRPSPTPAASVPESVTLSTPQLGPLSGQLRRHLSLRGLLGFRGPPSQGDGAEWPWAAALLWPVPCHSGLSVTL